MKKTNKIILMSVLVSQALILHLIESMIPVPFITPGAKIGLANIITVVCLYLFDFKETLLVIVLRLILSTFFVGSISSLMYSASGALISFFAMYLLKKAVRDKASIIGISSAGAVFHNVGQIFMASIIVQNIYVTMYLPVLTLAGIGTGFFVGLTSNYLIKYLKNIFPKYILHKV